MAPNIDWDAIMATDPNLLQDTEDDGLVNDWCNKLSEVCVFMIRRTCSYVHHDEKAPAVLYVAH